MESGIQIIKKVIQVANANIDFDERLQGILEIVTHRGDNQKGLLFLLAPNKGMLELKNISPREDPPADLVDPPGQEPFCRLSEKPSFSFHPPFKPQGA